MPKILVGSKMSYKKEVRQRRYWPESIVWGARGSSAPGSGLNVALTATGVSRVSQTGESPALRTRAMAEKHGVTVTKQYKPQGLILQNFIFSELLGPEV